MSRYGRMGFGRSPGFGGRGRNGPGRRVGRCPGDRWAGDRWAGDRWAGDGGLYLRGLLGIAVVRLGARVTGDDEASAARKALASGFSAGGASLASPVSDPPEKTSFSAPSIFMPPGFSGLTRIGWVSAVTTGTAVLRWPIRPEALISSTSTAPRPPANSISRRVSGSMPARTRPGPVP